MAAFESQMAAQRSLMADAGLGINTAQPDALMHHQLAMAQNQNRKSFRPLSLLSRWRSPLGGSVTDLERACDLTDSEPALPIKKL